LFCLSVLKIDVNDLESVIFLGSGVPVYLTSPPRKSESGFELSLEWCGLVIHTAHAARTTRSRFFFLGHLSHQCFCGKHESGDRSGVLQRRAGHLGRIEDAGRSSYLPVATLNPSLPLRFLTSWTITAPSWPALLASWRVGNSSARRTISAPTASSPSSLMRSSAFCVRR
jgi:hypothetical protein